MAANQAVGEASENAGYDINDLLRTGMFSNPSKVIDPALKRDILHTPNSNWWNTFINAKNEVQLSETKGQMLRIQRDLTDIDNKLYSGNYKDDKERLDLEVTASQLGKELTPMMQEIDETNQSIQEHPIDEDYRLETYKDQLKEKLTPGTFAQDVGGMFKMVATQGATAIGTALMESLKNPAKSALTRWLISRGAVSAETGPAAGAVMAGMLLYDGVKFGAGLYSMYEMQRSNADAIYSDAYQQKLNNIVKSREKAVGRPLTEQELSQSRAEAYTGIDQIDNTLMANVAQDYLQTLMLAGSFTKIIGKLGGTSTYAKLLSRSGEFGFQGISEGNEEAVESLVAGRYVRGDYDKSSKDFFSIDNLANSWDMTAENVKYILGSSDDQLTKTDDYRLSMRSGFNYGLLLGGLFEGPHVAHDISRFYKTKKSAKEFIEHQIKADELSNKVSRVDDIFQEGKIDKIYEGLDNLKSNNEHKEGILNITDEDISNAKSLVNRSNALLNKIESDPAYASLRGTDNKEKRVHAVSMIIGAQDKIIESNNKIQELDKQSDAIYTQLLNEEYSKTTPSSTINSATDVNILRSNLEAYNYAKKKKVSDIQSEIESAINKQESDRSRLLRTHTEEEIAESLQAMGVEHTAKVSELQSRLKSESANYDRQISDLKAQIQSNLLSGLNISHSQIKSLNGLKISKNGILNKLQSLEPFIKEDVEFLAKNKNQEGMDATKFSDIMARADKYTELSSLEQVLTNQYNDKKNALIDSLNIEGVDRNKISDHIDKVSSTTKDTELAEISALKYDSIKELSLYSDKLDKYEENPSLLLKDVNAFDKAYTKPKETEVKQATTEQTIKSTLPEVNDIFIHKVGNKLRKVIITGTGTTPDKMKVLPLDANNNPLTDSSEEEVAIKELSVYQKYNTTSTLFEEPLTDDELDKSNIEYNPEQIVRQDVIYEINRPLKSIYDAISSLNVDLEGKVVNRDINFSKLISTPTNTKDLSNATVSFELDTDLSKGDVDNIWSNDIKNGKTILRKIKNKEELTSGEISQLVNNAPIKVLVKVKDTTYDSGLYYHIPEYVSTTVTTATGEKKVITRLKVSQSDPQESINAEKGRINKVRYSIIKDLLNGTVPFTTGLTRTKGFPNNTDKQYHIPTAWKEDVKNIKLFIVNSDGEAMASVNEKYDAKSSPGTVLARTAKTCNGEEAMIKLTSSKLTSEHAGILYEAIIQLHSKGKGSKSFFENSDRSTNVSELTLGETIDLLANFGDNTKVSFADETSGAHEARWSEMGILETMRNKQLRVLEETIEGKKKYSLVFGNNKVDLFDRNNKELFTKWAIENKAYPVRMYKPMSLNGLSLNQTLNKSFEIGSWKYDKSEAKTYAQVLVDNPVADGTYAVTTNVVEYEGTGSLFKDPIPILSNKTDEGISLGKKIQEQPAKPTVAKPKEPVKSNSEGYTNVRQQELRGLEDGTVIYTGLGYVEEDVAKTMYSEDGIIISKSGNKYLQLNPSTYNEFGGKTELNLINSDDLTQLKDYYEGAKIYYKSAPVKVESVIIPQENQVNEIIQDNKEQALVEDKPITESKPIESKEVSTDIKPKISNDPIFDYFGEQEPLTRGVSRISVIRKGKIDKEVNAIKELLGDNFSIKIVDDFITIASSGKKAYATFENNIITLAKGLEYGTAYHEAFHAVSISLLNNKQINDIYNEAKYKYDLSGKSNREIEEVLAEKFREYMLSEEANRSKFGNKILAFFNRIFNWINFKLLKRNPLDQVSIDSLFKSIRNGKFRYSKPSTYSYTDSNITYPREIKGTNIKQIDTIEQQDSLIKSLTANLIIANNFVNLRDINNVKYSVVLDYINNRISNSKALLSEAKTVEDRTVLENRIDLYQSVIDNFDNVFLPEIKSKLKDLWIKIDDNSSSESDKLSFATDDDDYKAKYDKNPVEQNTKEKVLPEIKFLLSMLPEGKTVDEWSGLPKISNFSENWRELSRELHFMPTYDDMLKQIEKLSVSNPKWNFLRIALNKSDSLLHNKFFQVMSKHRHNFMDMNIITEGQPKSISKFYIIDTLIQNETNRLLNSVNGGIWGQNFSKSYLISKDKTKGSYIDLDKYAVLNKEYDDLKKDVKSYTSGTSQLTITGLQSRILDLFNKVGIDINNNTLDYILVQDSVESTNQALESFTNRMKYIFSSSSAIYSYAKDVSAGKKVAIDINLNNILNSESFIRNDLAKAYIKANAYKSSDMVYGPSGNAWSMYSDNSIVSDVIHSIKKDPSQIDTMLLSVNNKHSYILNQLKSSPNKIADFDIVTQSNYKEEDISDEGTEYTKLSKVDNYLLKLLHASQGNIPFPVLASKKLYYLFKGLDTIQTGNVVKENEKESFQISDKAVDVFHGYFLDEKNRIDKIKSDIQNATKSDGALDTTNLVENIHYKLDKKHNILYDDNHKPVNNGTRYMSFPSFNNTTIDLNNEVEVKAAIKSMLDTNLSKEIDFAVSLGIIERDGNTLKNIKLPADVKPNWNKSETYRAIYGSNWILALISDSSVNQHIGVFETEKLICGDPISYKADGKGNTIDDLNKRLSVLASTGAKGVETMVDPYTNSNGEVFDKTLSSPTYKVKSLYSNIEESTYLKELKDRFTTIYSEEYNIDRKEARKKAEDSMSAYSDCDNTDAQVFVSPLMYRKQKLKLGEWSNDHQEAFEAMLSNRPLLLEEEKKYRKFFMEPLKFVNFEHNFDSGVMTITYDKMSMAALFPKEVKGLQVEGLMNHMLTEGIDVVKFDTAVKAGNVKRGEFYTSDKTELSNFNNVPYKEQRWKYLRRQLLTDPHEIESIHISSQPIKVGLSNIVADQPYYRNGAKVTGKELYTDIFNILKELSNSGRKEVEYKYDIGIDGVASDLSLSEKLLDEAAKAKMSSNITDNLRIGSDGKFQVALDIFPQNEWIVNRLISDITKKTVDVELPGGMMIQKSNVGYRTEKSDDLKFYRFDKDGGLEPMECNISASLLKNVIPNYTNLTYSQAVEWVKNNPIELVGYRVPSQTQASIVYLKIKNIIPEQSGDVIVLPTEFTKLTGSDFDIDKLYIIRHHYSISGGKSTKIEFKGKSEEELKYIQEVTELRQSGKLTEAKIKEIEESLMKIPSFRNKYNTKLREQLNRGYGKILSEEYDKFKELESSINSYYKELDQTKSEIVKLKTELDYIRQELSNTTDEEKKVILKQAIASKLNNIAQIREDVKPAIYEKLLGDKITATNSMSAINEELVKRRMIDSKIDFLFNSEYEQNTKKAAENRLIDNIITVLKDKKHIIHTISPLDLLQNKLIKKAKEIEPKKALNDLERSSMYYQSKVKDQFARAKGGTAFAALHNVHHSLGQTVGLELKPKIDKNVASILGVSESTDAVFSFKGENTILKSLSEMKGIDGEYIHGWISALINAFVDIEKDPYIVKLNVNDTTYNTVFFLLRAGLGEKTFDFISQPILKELANIIDLNSGMLTNVIIDPTRSKQSQIFKYSVSEVRKKYSENAEQLAILDQFEQFKSIGDALGNLVNNSQIDTKKFGSNILEMRAFDARRKQLLEDNMFNGTTELLENVDNSTHLGTLYANSVEFVEKMLSNKMIQFTPGFKLIYDNIFKQIGKENSSDEKLINIIGKEIKTELISEFFTSKDYLGYSSEQVKDLFKGDNSIASRVYNIQLGKYLPELKDKKLFTDLLNPEFFENGLHYLKTGFRKDRDGDGNIFIEGFKDMLSSTNPEVVKFAKDLVVYSYFASGFKSGIFSIFQHIPVNYLAELKTDNNITFNDFITAKIQQLQRPEYLTNINEISDNVIKNNWYLNSIVLKIDYTRYDRKGNLVNIINPNKTETYKGYPRILQIDGIKSLIVGYTNAQLTGFSNPIFKKYIKVQPTIDGKRITMLAENIGFRTISTPNGTEFSPIYKTIAKSSINYKGAVVKENGLQQSALFSDEIPTGVLLSDAKELAYMSTNKLYPDFKYIPKEDRYVTDRNQDNIETVTINETKEYILSLPEYKQKVLASKLGVSSVDEIINHKDISNSNSDIAIKILDHIINCSE